MPKKAIFTRDHILNKAFEMLEKKGLEEITARNLAKALKSSPAPIYGFFKSMDDLKKELIERSKGVFMEYVKNQKTELPFLNIGMGIVTFAREEKQLFRSIFLREKTHQGLIQEFKELIEKEILADDRFMGLPEDVKETLVLDCWTYAHGMATLTCTGYFENPSDEFIKKRLMESAASMIYKRLEESSEANNLFKDQG
ncbi:TetR/AcrR family transcriptional regulator [uncultured Ilyobacter sp.]|uniref:TetR/AcrR family transcriptional regulator n=1 Tax=uncultured Ilyobacter sp. TaxID=544433 RepID=UPI0029C7722C|nr:TetR/AcrR family transcriptional regulator [uncultured Ilyobacter sp.]